MNKPNAALIMLPTISISLGSTLRFACMILLTIVLGACNAGLQADTESNGMDLEAERETLMALERAWSDMYGQGDVEGIAALLAEESVLLAPGHPPAVGRDSVVALTRALLATEAADGVSVSWEPQAAFVSPSGDMAWDYGLATTTLADGTVITGSYLVVWIKENGEWKVAADIFT